MSDKKQFSEADLKHVAGGSVPPPEKPSFDDGDGGQQKGGRSRGVTPEELASLSGGGDPKGTRGIPAPEPEAGGSEAKTRPLTPEQLASLSGGGDPKGTRGIPAPQPEAGGSEAKTRPLTPEELASLSGGGDPKGTRGIPAPEPETRESGGKRSSFEEQPNLSGE
ncbi:MAG: hypothetical protein ACYTJ0_10725 [Planctomycetota bacterium]|jgi:hypothetical protein